MRVGEDTIPPALARGPGATGRSTGCWSSGRAPPRWPGQAVAAAIAALPAGACAVAALPATELSGFGLSDDMSDTLVVAISQSGTTTDTNRTVDLARTRGAHVVAVVNRRNSDLAAKAHGVLYTSDGRDVEMSVASTKAFYAQVAAGWLLAGALAQAAATGRPPRRRATSTGCCGPCATCPTPWSRCWPGGRRSAGSRPRSAPSRRYWAVVGSGPDRIAAAEVRIKLSELCYRSISSDATEDKKHIDLSCEPLILVCAAGLRGPNADDVAKEVAIYRAHKAAPVVVATRRRGRPLPRRRPGRGDRAGDRPGSGVRAVGHGRPPVRLRGGPVDRRPGPPAPGGPGRHRGGRRAPGLTIVDRPAAARPAAGRRSRSCDGLREGSYNGNLEAATAVRLVSLLRYATGVLPLEGYELESGKIGAPSALIGDLLDALNAGIDELTRPVDAIKHQAKTVTVGISRSEDALFGVPLVKSHPGGRRRPRHPRLPGPAHPRRPRRGGGRGRRLHPLPHRLAADRRTHHRASSTRAASPGRCRSRTATRSPAAGHQAPGRRGAGGHRGAWAPATAAR